MKTVTIIAIAALAMPAMGYVYQKTTDIHAAHEADTLTLAMVDRIGVQLRIYDNRVHGFRIVIAKKEGQIFDLKKMMSEDPQIIHWQNELESELEGYRRLLQQLQERIRHEEKQKQSLMRKLATA